MRQSPRAGTPAKTLLCPHQPGSLYEINTRVWLDDLGVASLSCVPDAVLDDLEALGLDAVWLMGVWTPSPDAADKARAHPALIAQYRAALPDLVRDDVVASPYAVLAYRPSPALGSPAELADLRERLRRRGLGLILDFVPNHTACDHPWVSAHPERYVQAAQPSEATFTVMDERGAAHHICHGRDPYFPPWLDTAQLDYRRADTRRAMIEELRAVSLLCDGVRCDMAMLLLRDVFAGTWRDHPVALPAPGQVDEHAPGEPWAEAIDAVRAERPGFTFIAEAYWGTERRLQQLGFDYTYDKTLYDRLLDGDAPAIRAHLGAGRSRQRRFVRFLENHDEERAAHRLPQAQHLCAAMITALLPGLRLFHHGQLSGARRRLPVQLRRRAVEPEDPGVATFYRRLLSCLRDPVLRLSPWRLLPPQPAWPGNGTHDAMLAYGWDGSLLGERADGGHHLLVANLGAGAAQCRVPVRLPGLAARTVLLCEVLGSGPTPPGDAATPDGGPIYRRSGDDLASAGLFVELPGHTAQLLRVTPEAVLTSRGS